MPLFVGKVRINSVGPSSNVQNGDSAFIILSSSAKINAGSGSFSPGDSFFTQTFHTNETTTAIDPSLIENTAGRIM